MLKIILVLLMPAAFAGTFTATSELDTFQSAPEYEVIMAEIKTLGNFSSKNTVAIKTMSRGQQIVAEAKARNKALIAAQNHSIKTNEESVAKLSDLDRLKLEDKKTRDGWKQEVINQRKLWQKEQDIFLGRIKVYKENTFDIPVKKEVIIEDKVIEGLPEAHIVNSAFKIPIRDQQNRPTCSAFAGVRSIEILLAQK